jgi:methyltransferase-like protein
LELFSKIRQNVGANTAMIYAPTEDKYVNAINTKGKYDIIVIDGHNWREHCAKAVAGKLNPNGIVILDNSNEQKEAADCLEELGFLRVDFWGFCPGVAIWYSTSIFFDTPKG